MAVMKIEVELMNRTVAIANNHSKYPMYNMHFSDMNVANGRTQPIMGAVGSQGMCTSVLGVAALCHNSTPWANLEVCHRPFLRGVDAAVRPLDRERAGRARDPPLHAGVRPRRRRS